MSDEYYASIRNAIQQAQKQGHDKESVVWALAEGTCAIVDHVTDNVIAGSVCGGLQFLADAARHKKSGDGLSPNPWFVFNGHDDKASTYSKKYLRKCAKQGLASGLVGVAGTASSTVTQVDVAGIAQHSSAAYSTGWHLVKFRNISKRNRGSRTLSGWVDLLIRMKQLKLSVRGVQLAGASIPVGATGVVTGVMAAGAKLGIKIRYNNTCRVAAADIHWRAFQEQAISGGLGLGTGKNVGPASMMLYELFAKYGVYRMFSRTQVDKIIAEPCGWHPVAEKLLSL